MKIIHFETSPEDSALRISSGHDVESHAEALNTKNATVAADADVVTVFVNSVVDQDVIDALPKTKLIVTRSTGYDHIDVAYANRKGITVCYVPGYGSRTVAEFTYALMLNLSRKAWLAAENIKVGNNWDMSHFEGFNLQGKTLGVVGSGRIGMNVIEISKGFDMNVIATDAFPNEDKAKELGFRYVGLDELLKTADIVTLHVPATKETHHLINKDNIRLFKKGAMLINTSRGDVIDPECLILGLEEKILSGVGLDVLEGEHDLKDESELILDPSKAEKIKVLLEDHILMKYPNVIITPHIAFNTTEAKHEITAITLENIRLFAAGTPQNVVKI